jgi:hypothetical protein
MNKILTIILIISAVEIYPQLHIRMQGTAALPTGYAEDAVDVGYGGNINASFKIIASFIELSATAGYYHFGLKEDLPDYDFSFRSIPVLAGFRIMLDDYNFIPYAGIEGGIYITRYLLEIDYGFFGKSSVVTNDTHFGFSPEIGFRMNITPAIDIDVNGKYNRIFTKYIARSYLLIQSGILIRL